MNLKELKQRLLENPEVRKAFEDKTDLYFEISEMVEKLRASAGLTQAQLAKKIGTKQSSIARIESGATLPSLSFLKKIAEALGTSLLPPRFESLEKLRTKSVESYILDISDWPKATGRDSGQKLLIKQLIK